MRVQHVIITTSGVEDENAHRSLDRMIRKVLDLRKHPILVVGPEGDSVLLASRLAEMCELVFDPNFNGQIFSSVKAGLQVTAGPAFVLPLKEASLSAAWEKPEVWESLERELDQTTSEESDVLQALTQEANPGACCYPCVVTRKGARNLLTLEAQADWMASERIRSRAVSIE